MSDSTELAVQKESTELVVVTGAAMQEMREVGDAVARTHKQIAEAEHDIERMVLQAKLMRFLHERISEDVVDCLKMLENNVNGFLTDKKEGYSPDVIKEVAISAWLQGARMVANEVNVIAGRCYLTKEYYNRKIKELGLRNYQQQISQPEIQITGKTRNGSDKGEAYFSAIASWMQHGEVKQIKCSITDDGDFRIACNYSGTDSPDTLKGKAESKLWRMVFKMAAGYELLDEDEVRTLDAPQHTITHQEADQFLSPSQVWDEAEKRTHEALQKCRTLKQIQSVEDSAIKFVDEHGELDEDAKHEIGTFVRNLCEHKREEIKSGRGERSNS